MFSKFAKKTILVILRGEFYFLAWTSDDVIQSNSISKTLLSSVIYSFDFGDCGVGRIKGLSIYASKANS